MSSESNQKFSEGMQGGAPPSKEGEKIDLKIAHWCLFAPRTSGMYETVRELITAENQIDGVLAGLCSTPGPKAPKHVVKKEAEGGRVDSFHPELRTQDWGWARKWADVHIIHSTMATFLKDIKPKVFFHHGCFHREQLIKMSDGSSKPIHAVRKGDLVLSYNAEESRVESNTVSWAGKNGKTGEWVRLSFEHGPMLMATIDHPVFKPSGYKVNAGDLKEGDLVAATKPVLSYLQEQIVLGKNLGDGHFHHHSLEWSHKTAHSSYNDLLLNYFKGFDLWKGTQLSGYGTEMERIRVSLGTAYRGINPLEDMRDLFYENDAKIISDEMLDKFDWPALAVLYYDDGGVGYTKYESKQGTQTYLASANIAMCSYDIDDVHRIANAFSDTFGLVFSVSNNDYPRIHIFGKKNLEPFFKGITEAFPTPECMDYKIPDGFRASSSNVLSSDTLKFEQFENVVVGVDYETPFPKYKKGSEYTRWALTVEGNHNYYAGVNLVSNTPEACLVNDLERGTSSFLPAANWTRDFELSFVTSTRAARFWDPFEYTGHKIKQITKGIDLDWWTRSATRADLEGDPSVLYGEIWRGIKHPFHTLYALKELHERRPEMKFNPWGLNMKRPFWEKIIANGGFSQFIGKWGLKGIVDYPEHYYSRGDVLVRPGLYGDQSRVGMEAMACGCPTVGWDSDPFGDAKLYKYAKAFDVSDMSAKIEEVSDKVLNDRAGMAKECRAMAEKHMDVNVEAQQVVGHLRAMLSDFKAKNA